LAALLSSKSLILKTLYELAETEGFEPSIQV
jgi:hypothetical protein